MRIQACQIPMHYLHHIAALLSSMGVDTHAWLAKNHLQTQQLQETTHSLSFTQFCQLVHDAIMLSGEPALGLLLGKRLSLNTHGLLGYAAMSSGTLCEALQVFERYGRLRTPLLKIQQQNTLIVVQERYPLPDDLRRSVSEAVVLTLKNMLDSLSGIMHPVRSVQFAFPAPSYAARVVQLFQCEVRFGQTVSGLRVSRTALEHPCSQAHDPSTYHEALTLCQRELDKMEVQDSLSGRIRQVLQGSHDDFPSLTQIAQRLHMTPRTLHRTLQLEHTSYRALIEEERHARARHHLSTGQLSIQQIAYAVGYSDIANFRRAFKRWEGVAPSTWRAKEGKS